MKVAAEERQWPGLSRPSRAGSDSSIAWALRALRRELLGFRFEYPIDMVAGAHTKDSLRYHVTSERLFLDDLEFDADGVAMRNYRALGRRYNPVFVAWWGLVSLDRYIRGAGNEWLDAFFTQVRWLKAHAWEREDGTVLWLCHFPWQEGRCLLPSPWYSAMYQGVVISTLVRAYRINGDEELLTLCRKGARVFELPLEQGGVRTVEDGLVLYEEYPGYPLARVLDGFMFSLLGLYDLHVQTEDPLYRRLFTDGLEGLVGKIRAWDYRRKWSWYGTHGYLCPPHYHKLNGVLLTVLGTLTGEKTLLEYARCWDIASHSLMDKAEIFLMFMLSKNLARLRLPRN